MQSLGGAFSGGGAGNRRWSPDTDTAFVFGRVAFPTTLSDYAMFSHFDCQANDQFGVAQNGAGTTLLNAKGASGGLCFSTGGTTRWAVDASTLELYPAADITYDFGKTAKRVRNAFIGGYVELTVAGSPPDAPAAGYGRLYLDGTGAHIRLNASTLDL